MRIDFRGVIKNSVKIELERSKNFLVRDAPKELEYDASFREFGFATGLLCDCCKISAYLGDGVIRLIISKEMIDFC